MKIQYNLPTDFEITNAEYAMVKRICDNGANPGATGIGKVTAIKFIKDQYNLSLREAKAIVDAIAAMSDLVPVPASLARDWDNGTAGFNDTLSGMAGANRE